MPTEPMHPVIALFVYGSVALAGIYMTDSVGLVLDWLATAAPFVAAVIGGVMTNLAVAWVTIPHAVMEGP